MNPATFQFDQIAEDLVAFNYFNAWAKPAKKSQRRRSQIQVLVIAALAVVIVLVFQDQPDWTLISLLAGASLAYVALLGFFVKLRVSNHIQAVVKKSPQVIGPRTWQVDDKAIRVLLESGDQVFPWREVKEVAETDKHWMLYLDNKQALVLPKRALISPELSSRWAGWMEGVGR